MPELRQNLGRSSEDFTNGADWILNAATLVANTPDTLAPNGTQTATKMTDDTSTGVHWVISNTIFWFLAGHTYTTSVYMKRGTKRFGGVSLDTGGSHTLLVDLDTGLVSFLGSNPVDAEYSRPLVENVGNGWWRISLMVRMIKSANARSGIALIANDSGITTISTGTGDGTIYIWGAQCVEADHPGIYVKTTTAVVNPGRRVLRDRNPGNTIQNLAIRSDDLAAFPAIWSNSNSSTVQDSTVTDPFGGNRTFRVTATGGSALHYVFDSFTVPDIPIARRAVGRLVTISAFMKRDPLSSSPWAILGNDRHSVFFRQWVNLDTGQLGTLSDTANAVITALHARSTPVGNGWYRVEATFQMNDAQGGVGFQADGMFIGPAPADGSHTFAPAGTPESILVTGCQVNIGTNSATSYTRTTDTIIDRGFSRQLLPVSQNLVTFSEEMHLAPYTAVDVTLANDPAIVDPRGGTGRVTKVAETATTAIHFMYWGAIMTTTPSRSWAASCYFKMGTRRYAGMRGADGQGHVLVDLLTGLITAESHPVNTNVDGGSASVENAGNGWWRITLVTNFRSTTTAPSQFVWQALLSHDGAGEASYLGAPANFVYVWGAQVVRADHPGSYVRTQAAKLDVSNLRLKGAARAALPVAQNQLLRSEDFANAAWQKQGITISSGATAPPPGVGNADKIVESNANEEHTAFQAAPVGMFASMALSVFVKAGERRFLLIGLSFSGPFICYDALTNTVTATSGTIIRTDVDVLPNGWARVTLVAPPVTAAAVPLFEPLTSSGASRVSYQGDGVSGIFVAGAQYVEANWAGPYVKTLGTVVNTGRIRDITL